MTTRRCGGPRSPVNVVSGPSVHQLGVGSLRKRNVTNCCPRRQLVTLRLLLAPEREQYDHVRRSATGDAAISPSDVTTNRRLFEAVGRERRCSSSPATVLLQPDRRNRDTRIRRHGSTLNGTARSTIACIAEPHTARSHRLASAGATREPLVRAMQRPGSVGQARMTPARTRSKGGSSWGTSCAASPGSARVDPGHAAARRGRSGLR